ncbi:hypothetical protein [Mucilaginibacter aquariorum]|uniref:Cytochrome c oxidase subunit II n=1 Tax=Mucilaginibacter aquariorum TaxID=2967225 RepID=A0ABT1T1A2_9SPHI|nr:hypothetical protein [Mucilaginibacter aquariorum]MCQ6958243.1 hypothetical protein [Mucilaginibacter aquariorum]
MFTRTFQLVLIFSSFVILGLLVAYGWYCRNRSQSFIGSGRVTDIETWHMKATLSWIATFIMMFAMAVWYMVD